MHRHTALSVLSAALMLALASPVRAQTLPGFAFADHVAPENTGSAACRNASNYSAKVGAVQVGQTHLLETSHPFFHLSANRAAVIRAVVTGTGNAPAVKVTASANGTVLGSLCLKGPATLPAAAPETPSLTTSYVGALPAAWLRKGLQLTVAAGASSKTLSVAELKIGAAPVLTFVTADWLLFGDTAATPIPAGFGAEFSSKLPLTKIQHSVFPLPLKIAELPVGPRSDGYTPTGVVGAQPAVVATSTPHCTSTDKTRGTCTPWSGFGVLDAVRSLTYRLQVANGLDGVSHWYGALSKNRQVGGGLGGGVVASGDDYSRTFNHEFGHTFDLPHLGGILYDRVAEGATAIHPYTGAYLDGGKPVGGGFGNSWAYDPLTVGGFINPVCATTAKERQEPMQRYKDACVATGRVFDHFGDYSALAIHRYFVGAASVYAGKVGSPRDLNNNTNPPFSFPTKSGRPNLVLGGPAPVIQTWNAAAGAYEPLTPAKVSSDARVFGERYPLQWNVPVYTLWGSFSNTTPTATTIQPPLKYLGNLKRVWDPTSATDFAEMKKFISGDGFWWGADLVAKAEFSDGTFQHALVKATARGGDKLGGGSFTYWAVNIPAPVGKSLARVSLYHRPMEVQYGDGGKTTSSYYKPTNLNSSLSAAVSSANYLSTAKLVATRQVAP